MRISGNRTPFYVVVGVDTELSLTLTTDAGAAVTPSAMALALYAGGSLVDSPTVTPGASSVATVLAAVTSGLAVGTRLDARWTPTIAGVLQAPLNTSGYVVRVVPRCVVQTSDLEDEIADLTTLTGVSDFSDELNSAFGKVTRWFHTKGKRAFDVLDEWALFDITVYWTLATICARQAITTREAFWLDSKKHYGHLAGMERDNLVLTLDGDGDGVGDESATAGDNPVFMGGIY